MQAFLILAHMEAGRPELAALVALMEPAFFAEWDDLMRAAYLAGAKDALTD